MDKRQKKKRKTKIDVFTYNHAGEIRTVPMASFPTFFVTENKLLLFLQPSLTFYLAIQWEKNHKNFSWNTCLRCLGIGTAYISESPGYWFLYRLVHKASMNQHFSSCVLAPANTVKVTLEIRKALISNSSHGIPMWGPYPREPADLKILLADI